MAIKMSLLRSCSGIWTRIAIKMSLLTELLRYLDAYGYKDAAPTELQTTLYQIPRAFSDRTLGVTEMVRRCA